MSVNGRTDVVAAVAAIAAVASFALAWRTDQRLDRQEEEQVASRVALSEAPKFAYDERPPEDLVYWVVMNYSGSQVDDVWVEGDGGASVRIGGVQPCSLYALPDGFRPVAVHFSDTFDRWRREVGSGPARNGEPPPRDDTADSPFFLDLPNCP